MDERIFTVGHSTRAFDDVLALLRANEVTHLVDVRSFPSSRKYPQWNQQAVIDAIPEDIGYRWIAKLGGRRHTPKDVPSVNGAWRVKAFRDYADYMATPDFAAGLAELLTLADDGRPAIMCSEAVPWRCHRRLITDALLVAGRLVWHILSATRVTPAVLNEHAEVQDGHLVYPAQPRKAGTSLVEEVREEVLAIPAGRVASYGDIGERIAAGPRQVGRAMSQLDDGVPWWRLVHADGTPPSCRGGRAAELLRAEGTPMRGARVDMRRARHRAK